MRKRNRKFEIAGRSRVLVVGGLASAGALAGLLTLAANPVAQQVVEAAGVPCASGQICNTDGTKIDLNAGDLVVKESSVAITISASSGNAKLSAEEGWGTSKAQGIVRQTASVAFGATDGYTIKISGNPTLKGTDSRNTIAGVTGATTLAQMRNQWGWYSADGNVDCSAENVFRGMTTAGETVASGSLSEAATKMVTMCFGAKVDGMQAGDTYSNTVTVSAVAEPSTSRTMFSGIKTLQEMTPTICAAAKGGSTDEASDTAYLKDERDGKYYWVTKLADGNCWMSQNLDLDLSKSRSLTADTSATAWTPGQDTQTSVTAGSSGKTDTYSWDLGEYVLNTPTATTACASNNVGLSECAGQGFVKVAASDGWTASGDPNFYRATSYTGKDGASCSKSENSAVNASASANCKYYDAHYLVGNYYQWNAATAGTGGEIADMDASGSICPKGWKLPSSGDSTTKGTFGYMLSQYGVENSLSGASFFYNTYNVALSPLFFVRGGNVGSGIHDAGQNGNYWSSRALSNITYARLLYFDDSSVKPSEWEYRFDGCSLRCLVQTP